MNLLDDDHTPKREEQYGMLWSSPSLLNALFIALSQIANIGNCLLEWSKVSKCDWGHENAGKCTYTVRLAKSVEARPALSVRSQEAGRTCNLLLYKIEGKGLARLT